MRSSRLTVNLPFNRALGLALVPAALLLGSCAHTSSPLAPQKGPVGYVTDASGNVVRSGSGQCIRTGFWNPQDAIKECDPGLFAQAPPPPVAVANAPAEPDPTPPPEETAAAEPETTPVRIYVGADTYFGFNQAELDSQNRQTLDRIAERAQDAEDASIRIVGYADQIGPDEYNQSLSQRRADAVRTYLIEQGVPETAVSVEARGEADPVVACEGRQGATLIDCLQPNRRTEVEFSALEPVEDR